MTTVKGSPVTSLQESTSSAAAGSSPTVNGVGSVGGSSPAVPSSPSRPSPSAAEGSISTTAPASSSVPPTVGASPGTWTGVPPVIPNTYPPSPLPSRPSELVVATSAPRTSTASTADGGVVGGGSGSSTSPSSPRGTPNTTSPTSDQETSSPGSELSAGAKAGIGVSIAVACLGIISAVFYFGWRRRRDERNPGLGEDTVSWLRHAGEKHRTLQAIPAFGPTRKVGGGDRDGSGAGGLAMSLEPSSHLTYLSLGSEPSPGDDMSGIGMALSSDIYDALDSPTLVAEGGSETPLRDGDLDSPVMPRFMVPHGDSPA
ncbi:hypothetical protein MAC_03372 [Metarhizium acridum CQMa 102]|uniref:Uncharacterized protein n=2 Tax=Metarhizium acridum TaxID=92637 RepID=E9E0H4_METAQ|nr:uncharacterized protein MAC_03372 [Metarhizium acridum CQMa 102]EFY90594.1 hypothetical protein MAC_03372 [Metarhizium acridum CQMa 102]